MANTVGDLSRAMMSAAPLIAGEFARVDVIGPDGVIMHVVKVGPTPDGTVVLSVEPVQPRLSP